MITIIGFATFGCSSDPSVQDPDASVPETDSGDVGDVDAAEPVLQLACRGEEDEGIDGSINIVWSYQYNDLGLDTARDGDRGDNGVVDLNNKSEYDTNGNLTRYAEDENNDGSPEFIYGAVFGEDGVLEETLDYNGDGIAEERSTRTYNDGRLLTREDDQNGDGNIDARETSFYDERDVLVRVDIDNGADGSVDVVRTFVRDDEGFVREQNEDSNGDQLADLKIEFGYDSEGRLVRHALDLDVDGVFDELRRWVFDLEGRQTDYEIDFGADGTLDFVFRERYNARGQRESTTIETSRRSTITRYLYAGCPIDAHRLTGTKAWENKWRHVENRMAPRRAGHLGAGWTSGT